MSENSYKVSSLLGAKLGKLMTTLPLARSSMPGWLLVPNSLFIPLNTCTNQLIPLSRANLSNRSDNVDFEIWDASAKFWETTERVSISN